MSSTQEIWIPILVGGVVLGGLGYLVVTTTGLTGNLHSVQANVLSTMNRVDRIADALPSMNILIAHEEVERRPIQTALISSAPTQQNDGTWVVVSNLIDVNSKEKTTYKIKLEDKDDRQAVYAIIGLGHFLETTAVSASELSDLSLATNQPHRLPPDINSESTIIFRRTDADRVRSEMVQISSEISAPVKLDENISNWSSLQEYVTDNLEMFKAQ